MVFLALITSLMAALAGSVCFYMASPNQLLRPKSWPPFLSMAAGSVLFAISLFLLLVIQRADAAIFEFVCLLMLLFVLIPHLGAWLHVRRSDQ